MVARLCMKLLKNMESPQQILNDIHGVPRNETKPYQWKIQILARILNHFKVIVVTEDCDHQSHPRYAYDSCIHIRGSIGALHEVLWEKMHRLPSFLMGLQ